MTHPHQHLAFHLAAWLGMLVLAVANGAFREALLTPNLGDTLGRQLSTALLLALFAGWFWFLHRRWPLSTARQTWLVGVLWLVMTLALETFMGRVLAGKPWPEVFEDYNVLAGRIWVLVPLWTLVGPHVFFRWSSPAAAAATTAASIARTRSSRIAPPPSR
jgi:hypothetical protein